jgi:hypothetical protein
MIGKKIAILDLKFGGRKLAWLTLFLNLSAFGVLGK